MRLDENKLMRRDLLLTRQKGNVSSTLLYLIRETENGTERPIIDGFLAHLKCDISDLLIQTEQLAKDLGFNVDEIRTLGGCRVRERKKECNKEKKAAYWL